MDHLNQTTTDTAVTGDKSASAMKARITMFCSITGDDPVKLAARRGEVCLTDELISWCQTNGASLDWITSGDVTAMIRACRRQRLVALPPNDASQRIPERNLAIVVAALKAHGAGLMPLDQALEAMRQAVVVDEVAAKP